MKKPTSVRSPSFRVPNASGNLFVATGKGIEARDVLPPGQSGFVAADGKSGAHFGDQLGLYAEFGYKPVPFTPQQVRAFSVGSRVLLMPPE